MGDTPANNSGSGNSPTLMNVIQAKAGVRARNRYRRFVLLAAAIFLAPLLLAQDNPQVTTMDPTSGKVNDSVTLTGENLGKGNVVAVFLSDDKDDFKATIVEQSNEKIVMKVPQVKSGSYNLSVQVGDKILIKPIRFTVEE